MHTPRKEERGGRGRKGGRDIGKDGGTEGWRDGGNENKELEA